MIFKIGVDGGGSKTECILVDMQGRVIARHLAPGSNPSLVSPEQARRVVTEALREVLAGAKRHAPRGTVAATLLCMAGNRAFWSEFGGTLSGFGVVQTADDSLPVLELATQGRPGLVLHAGTGSFIAARAPDGGVHYAGGLGWRFGDPGSGYDLGRRAVARALLELQGWSPESRLAALVREHTDLTDAGAISRFFYSDPAPNQKIAALAPAVLRLAHEGEAAARELVERSAGELAELATRVAVKLFPVTAPDSVPAGLSGPILTHPAMQAALAAHTSLSLVPLAEPPIEGVRRLLVRRE